jgi:hypothetical protein
VVNRFTFTAPLTYFTSSFLERRSKRAASFEATEGGEGKWKRIKFSIYQWLQELFKS